MGEIVTYRPPRAREESTAFVGMVVFLASWAMLFASLFFAYGVVRARAVAWPPPGVPVLPVKVPALNTVLLGLSSAALQYALASVRRGRTAILGRVLLTSCLLGIAFLVLQFQVWIAVHAEGLTADRGTYPSVFYALTGIHAAHVGIGLGALGWMAIRAAGGAYTAARHLTIRLWTLYWHFVGVVWLLMFAFVYLV